MPCSTEFIGADGCRPSTMVVRSNGAGDIEFPIAGAPPEGLIGFGVEPFRRIGTAAIELTEPTACWTPSTAFTWSTTD